MAICAEGDGILFPLLPVLLAALVTAQPAPAPAVYTVKEIAEYRLTVAVFERFGRASRLIARATAADPGLAERPPFTRDVLLLDDVVVAAITLDKRLRSEPALAAALGSAKISPHEYTTFALALVAARLA